MIRFSNLAIILIALLVISCSRTTETQLRVEVLNHTGYLTVELHKQGFSSLNLIETKELHQRKPSVLFNLEDRDEPTFYFIRFIGARISPITILVEREENVHLTIDMDQQPGYTVEGSQGSVLAQQLADRLRISNRQIDSLRRLHEQAVDPIMREALSMEAEAVRDSQRAFSTRFIWEHPRSFASIMALYQQYRSGDYVLGTADDHLLFRMVGSAMQVIYPESEYTKGLVKEVMDQIKIISSQRVNQIIQQSEKSLPEIALPNPQGDTIRLSSLRGKVILLDFWASWHSHTLMLNRELLEIYPKYNPRGFEVFQVSLDFEHGKWVDAINSASLPWINVSELTPNWPVSAAIYNVTQIPANYLINRDFDIVGRNLYGDELEAKIRELL